MKRYMLSIILANIQYTCMWGAAAQQSEHLQLKQEALGSIPSGCPTWVFCCCFFFLGWLTNVDGMKDLWCSIVATVRSCYQHKYEWKDLWCFSTVKFSFYQHNNYIDMNNYGRIRVWCSSTVWLLLTQT